MILYNASSSYYSMIARFALYEANIAFDSRRMDIHIAKEQLSPWYMEINPHMTVPTLVDGDLILIDSSDILRLAASSAGERWLDGDLQTNQSIRNVVESFYLIPIEDLTFAKAMIKFPPLHFLFPKLLANIVRKLKSQVTSSSDSAAILAKISLNESRINYFTQGNLLDKLNIERQRVSQFLSSLPKPQNMLFGDKPSSADIVVSILLGRLKMVGEYDLFDPYPELNMWFSRMQQRSSFQKADIWQKFQLWRILFKR